MITVTFKCSQANRLSSLHSVFGSVLLGSSALAAACVLPSFALAQSVTSYDVPAGALADAINSFAEQSGAQVLYDAALTEGRNSGGLRGQFAVAEGLSRLLSGSGLTFRVTGSNIFTLELAPQASNGAVQLGPVRVEGASGTGSDTASLTSDPAATEGTGSYTTRSMDTATGLGLSIRETPQSVTVLTRQQMDDRNIISLQDAISAIPGLSVMTNDYSGDSPTFMARGFTFDTLLVDGMAIGTSASGSYNGSTDDMVIYDRIEVLRGADGLLLGSGTPSAAVNLIRKRPTRDPQTHLTGYLGSWNNFRGEVDVSGPLDEGGRLRGRIVAAYTDKDSFIDVVHQRSRLVYGTLEADLAPPTTIRIGGSWRDNDTDGMSPGLADSVDGKALDLPRSTYLGTDYSYEDTSHKSVFGEIRQGLGGDWEAKLSGQIQNMDADFVETTLWYDSNDVLRLAPSKYHYYQRRASAELQASGSYTLFGRQHKLVVGANWRKHHRGGAGGWDAGTWSDTGGIVVDPFNWNPYGHSLGTIDTSLWSMDSDSREWGFYANTQLKPTDSLGILLGSRFSFFRQKGAYERNWIHTPYAGLTWAFDHHHSFYTSYTQIFQAQNVIDKNGDALPPITGHNFEAGIKGEYFDGLLNLSASFFLMTQRNRPVDDLTSTNPCRDGTRGWCQRAAGKVESKGIELEASGQLSPQWQISAGYSYARAVYKDDDDASLIGERFDASAPEYQFKLTTRYEMTGILQGWDVGGTLRYQSSILRGGYGGYYHYLDGQGAYALAGLRVGYRINANLRADVNVENLLDKTYYSGLGWGIGRTYGAPRNVLLTVRGQF